ncbi:MAG TPA: HAMP domain-containing sensor histidine kinase [Cyclobacteriaceae bacterium]|jgi:two-component system phosphate regulon sensor histidine kinase PhoR|nr:HAMP domain-containing sensor histidine kinase [Cyclobacteriaceae bacterium]
MKNKHLRIVIIWGTVVLTCLIVVQLYWFSKAFNVAEKQFDHSVQMALQKVADSMSNKHEIRKLASNFFFVDTESDLDNAKLDRLLKKEFDLRDLHVGYELGIYRADDDTLVYGNYIAARKEKPSAENSGRTTYYSGDKNFAVYFPDKKSYVAAQLDIWIFSSVVLLLMMSFFAYAIASLLRERKFAELKSDFINNMTHEFKTPVTNIKIAAEILNQKYGDLNGSKVYLDILLKENEKLRLKIDEVLLGSTLEFKKYSSFTTMDVHELIHECADAFDLKIREREGNLSLELNAKSQYILGDREMLAQAINNVIDNAEKYSPDKPRITVRTTDNKGKIEIIIIDEGIGIANDLKSKVFEKFYRVTTGDQHSVKGFGLGLSFVKTVIRKHQGRVLLLSKLNQGTEVRIILPKA